MQSGKQVTCAYCGKPEADPSGDHVVPSSLWGGKGHRPKFPAKVPACEACHHEYDQHAEYFRNMLAMMMGQNVHPIMDRLLSGKIARSLERSQRAVADVLRRARWMPNISPGGLVHGLQLGAQIDL